ncbi:MAG: phosphatase PAP2 family protein [Candidatus Kapaibacterium sp.]|jgi:hypothetical protein
MNMRYVNINFSFKVFLKLFEGSLIFLASAEVLRAQEPVQSAPLTSQHTTSPAAWEFITELPNDWSLFAREAFQWKHAPVFAGIAVTTAASIVYDDILYAKGKSLYQSSPAMSFAQDRGVDIGDGKFQFGIAAAFAGYGLLASDNRALKTASQVTEVILAAGTVVQVLKHVTGRESPFVATTPTGRWDFFPNQIEYHKKIPHYDAYPSGHVCTALATLTVILENYPEATWLPYVGYPAVTWLAISMVGQGIHWVSDYPLSVAIGYGFGQIVSHKNSFSGKFSSIFSGSFSSIFGTTTQAQILPARFADGTMGAQIICSW